MSIQADIYKLLMGPHESNTPAFGSNVFADYLPKGTSYPAIVYEMDPSELDEDWDGPNGFETQFINLILHNQNKENLDTDIAYVRDNLHGFIGNSFDGGVSGTINLSNTILNIDIRPGSSYYDEDTEVFIQEMELEIKVQN